MHTTAASAAGCLLYLAVFLAAGWLAARRALPGAPAAVAVPLGCAFGVSFLAALPALAALALGFTPGAALAGGAAALALALVLRLPRGLCGCGRALTGIRPPRPPAFCRCWR